MGFKFAVMMAVILTDALWFWLYYSHKHIVEKTLAYVRVGRQQGRDGFVVVNGYRQENHMEKSEDGIPIYVLQEKVFEQLGPSKMKALPIMKEVVKDGEKCEKESPDIWYAGIGFSRRYFLHWKALLIPAVAGVGSCIIGAPNPNVAGMVFFAILAEIIWLIPTTIMFPAKWRWKCVKGKKLQEITEKTQMAVAPEIYDETVKWLESLGLKEQQVSGAEE